MICASSIEAHLVKAHVGNQTGPVHVTGEVRKPAKPFILFLLSLVLSACTGSVTDTTSPQPLPTTTSVPRTSTSTPAVTSSTEPNTTSTTEPRFCTEIGCDSLLTIELTEVDITPEAIYDVEICVDDVCATETVTIDQRHPGTGEIQRGESPRAQGTLDRYMIIWAEDDHIDYYLPEADYDSSASVTFTITNSDGDVLARTDGPADVPLERSQPNGPGCPPVCFFGRMTV